MSIIISKVRGYREMAEELLAYFDACITLANVMKSLLLKTLVTLSLLYKECTKINKLISLTYKSTRGILRIREPTN